MRKFFDVRLNIALVLLLVVFTAGVVGYRFISGYGWVDALYMTIITVTTVGYGEVHPMTFIDKLFTSFLILSSLVIVGYALSVITEYLLSKNNLGNSREKRMVTKTRRMKDHVIVCGFGHNGQQAVEKLLDYKVPFSIIEKDNDVVERYIDDDFLFVIGDAIEDEVLIDAGLKNAKTLICALPSDADNLFIVLSARQINPELKIISRATEETSLRKLKLAGADSVVLPDKIGGDHMANLVVMPDLIEFLDNLSISGEKDSINVEQVAYEKVCPINTHLTIEDLDVRRKTGCSVIGYKTPNGEYLVNPEPSMELEEGSKLILIGRPDQIEKLHNLYES